jgi:hypothetical protein
MSTTSVPVVALTGQVGTLTLSNVGGTAAGSVTDTDTVTAQQHVTKLTFTDLNVEAVAGAAAEAIGALLYTLPANAHLIRSAFMDVGLTNTDSTIDADTPDVGLGTLKGDGANATLDAVGAAAENILTGQTAADVTGTKTTKGVSDQALVINPADARTIYLNIADTWAGADTMVKATGTVVIEWVNLS